MFIDQSICKARGRHQLVEIGGTDPKIGEEARGAFFGGKGIKIRNPLAIIVWLAKIRL